MRRLRSLFICFSDISDIPRILPVLVINYIIYFQPAIVNVGIFRVFHNFYRGSRKNVVFFTIDFFAYALFIKLPERHFSRKTIASKEDCDLSRPTEDYKHFCCSCTRASNEANQARYEQNEDIG